MPVSASRTTGKRVVRTKTNTWTFPYCQSCVSHVSAWDAAGGCALITLAIIAGFIVAVTLHPIVGLVTAIGGTAITVHTSNKKKEAARAMCSPQCTCPERAVTYVGWSGTVETFDINSDKYALAFMLANREKLINLSSEQWAKLQGAAQASPTPSVRISVTPVISSPATQSIGSQPPQPQSDRERDHAFLKWIEKVESAKGPAARRAAVELALKDEALGDRRDEFVKTAAQIEVRATLDKVETLKTPAAKRRHLADALAALRADSAADELQQAEIEYLEAALRELDEGRS